MNSTCNLDTSMDSVTSNSWIAKSYVHVFPLIGAWGKPCHALSAEFSPLCYKMGFAGLSSCATHDDRLSEGWMLLNVLVQKHTRTVLCETMRYNVRFVVSDGSGNHPGRSIYYNCCCCCCCHSVASEKKVSIILTPPPNAIAYVPSWQW